MGPRNIHASAVLVEDRGVLVTGPSGAGKTGLCLAIRALAAAHGVHAALVGDDQVFIAAHGGRVVVRAAPPLADLVEARGFGPAPMVAEPAMLADLVVRLVDAASAPRLAPEGATIMLEGCELPLLELAAGAEAGAARAVFASLAMPPFAAAAPGLRQNGRPTAI